MNISVIVFYQGGGYLIIVYVVVVVVAAAAAVVVLVAVVVDDVNVNEPLMIIIFQFKMVQLLQAFEHVSLQVGQLIMSQVEQL